MLSALDLCSLGVLHILLHQHRILSFSRHRRLRACSIKSGSSWDKSTAFWLWNGCCVRAEGKDLYILMGGYGGGGGRQRKLRKVSVQLWKNSGPWASNIYNTVILLTFLFTTGSLHLFVLSKKSYPRVPPCFVIFPLFSQPSDHLRWTWCR